MIYLVIRCSGSYDDYHETPLFYTHDQNTAFMFTARAAKEIKELSILYDQLEEEQKYKEADALRSTLDPELRPYSYRFDETVYVVRTIENLGDSKL